MRVIQLIPTKAENYVNRRPAGHAEDVLAGRNRNGDHYTAVLTFPSVSIGPDENLTSATLRMDENGNRESRPVLICVGRETGCQPVYGGESYEWDVTRLIPRNGGDFQLQVFSHGSGVRRFEAGTRGLPELTLTVDEAPPYPCPCVQSDSERFEDIVKTYTSTGAWQCSGWIYTGKFIQYYYFIQNSGSGNVEVSMQISPDKNIWADDSGIYTVHAGETAYIIPLKESKYIGISFKNASGSGTNRIKVWFQGQKACR